jgi:hypothetical protein
MLIVQSTCSKRAPLYKQGWYQKNPVYSVPSQKQYSARQKITSATHPIVQHMAAQDVRDIISYQSLRLEIQPKRCRGGSIRRQVCHDTPNAV